jgi:hypothetical protein
MNSSKVVFKSTLEIFTPMRYIRAEVKDIEKGSE